MEMAHKTPTQKADNGEDSHGGSILSKTVIVKEKTYHGLLSHCTGNSGVNNAYIKQRHRSCEVFC